MARHEHVIGSFEAKTRLSELLRRVQEGDEYVIQVRGVPAARLVPYVSQPEGFSWTALCDVVRQLRQQAGLPVPIKELLEEGRKG